MVPSILKTAYVTVREGMESHTFPPSSSPLFFSFHLVLLLSQTFTHEYILNQLVTFTHEPLCITNNFFFFSFSLSRWYGKLCDSQDQCVYNGRMCLPLFITFIFLIRHVAVVARVGPIIPASCGQRDGNMTFTINGGVSPFAIFVCEKEEVGKEG